MKKLWQTSKIKTGEESIKSMKSRTQKVGYSNYVHMHTRRRGVEKYVIRYVRIKWLAPNKYCETFFKQQFLN